MNFKKITFTICFLTIVAFINFGCTSAKAEVPLSPKIVAETSENVADATSAVSENDEVTATNWPEYDKSAFPLIASLPKEGIKLYSIKGNGMVLKIHDVGFFLPWKSDTPSDVYPKLALGDYDSDGQNELSIILLSGRGTGVLS